MVPELQTERPERPRAQRAGKLFRKLYLCFPRAQRAENCKCVFPFRFLKSVICVPRARSARLRVAVLFGHNTTMAAN